MGRLAEAKAELLDQLELEPDNASALYHLAAIAHREGKLEDALTLLAKAENLDSKQAAYPYLTGVTMQDLGRLEDATAAFRRAIGCHPGLYQAYNNLGLVQIDQGLHEDAIATFENALRIKPDYAAAANNLGTVLRDSGRTERAVTAFRNAIRLQPEYAEAWDNLGAILMQAGQVQDAAQALREAVRLKPSMADAWHRLAQCLEPLGQIDEAINALRQAVNIRSGLIPARSALARLLAMINHTGEAIEQYGAIMDSKPNHLRAALGAALTLPVIYDSVTHIDATRARYEQGLKSLHTDIDAFLEAPASAVLRDIHWGNFFLAYQGQNDRDLQTAYDSFVTRLLKHCLPELMQPIGTRSSGRRRIRVGFASSFFRRCTVGMYFQHWITRLNRDRIESYVYQLYPRQDQVSREIELGCDHYAMLNGPIAPPIEEVARRIRADELDILVYPELGMCTQSFLLAALRLAPVQCAGWGHPVTTGHSNIDYYLSCAAMEPQDAQSHYSERLVNLPGIGTHYARPSQPTLGVRSDFGLPEDRTLYLFPQSLFKIHPDNDILLARVLEADSKGTLVFFQGRHQDITSAFIDRISKTFAQFGLDAGERLVMLPYMQHDDYLRVNQLCDIMLDCVHWSGGNTSLDALSIGLPVVTWPGRYMRGRQSAGMLKLIGLEQLIASDADEYVRVATRLSQDPAWRADIRTQLLDRIGALFERDEPITALEDFFLTTVDTNI